MPIEPPPSRYRVIERGRRLEVIDTLAHARTPHYVPQADAAPETDLPAFEPAAAEPVAFDPTPGMPWSEPPPTALDAVAQPAEPEWTPAPPPPLVPPGAPSDLLQSIATIVCAQGRSADGRKVLQTASFYDAKGPREIVLDPDGERAVGLAILVAAVMAMSAIVFALTIGWIGFVIVFVLVAAGRNAKTIATPWLDRLAARSP